MLKPSNVSANFDNTHCTIDTYDSYLLLFRLACFVSTTNDDVNREAKGGLCFELGD